MEKRKFQGVSEMVSIGKHQVLSFVPKNGKILDFNENDTDAHVCSLAGLVTPGTVAIILYATRASGTGNLLLYSNSIVNLWFYFIRVNLY